MRIERIIPLGEGLKAQEVGCYLKPHISEGLSSNQEEKAIQDKQHSIESNEVNEVSKGGQHQLSTKDWIIQAFASYQGRGFGNECSANSKDHNSLIVHKGKGVGTSTHQTIQMLNLQQRV